MVSRPCRHIRLAIPWGGSHSIGSWTYEFLRRFMNNLRIRPFRLIESFWILRFFLQWPSRSGWRLPIWSHIGDSIFCLLLSWSCLNLHAFRLFFTGCFTWLFFSICLIGGIQLVIQDPKWWSIYLNIDLLAGVILYVLQVYYFLLLVFFILIIFVRFWPFRRFSFPRFRFILLLFHLGCISSSLRRQHLRLLFSACRWIHMGLSSLRLSTFASAPSNNLLLNRFDIAPACFSFTLFFFFVFFRNFTFLNFLFQIDLIYFHIYFSLCVHDRVHFAILEQVFIWYFSFSIFLLWEKLNSIFICIWFCFITRHKILFFSSIKQLLWINILLLCPHLVYSRFWILAYIGFDVLGYSCRLVRIFGGAFAESLCGGIRHDLIKWSGLISILIYTFQRIYIHTSISNIRFIYISHWILRWWYTIKLLRIDTGRSSFWHFLSFSNYAAVRPPMPTKIDCLAVLNLLRPLRHEILAQLLKLMPFLSLLYLIINLTTL